MKITKTILFLLLILAPLFVLGQRWKKNRAEYVFGLGATNFLGELGGADRSGTNGMKDLDFAATKPLLSAGYAFKFTKWLTAQADFSMGYLSGNDALTNYAPRRNRNLHFRSPVYELSAKAQFGYAYEHQGRRYILRGARGMKNMNIGGYGFVGLGFFYFNPKAQDPFGRWVALQPLSTEGQGIIATRKKYHRAQVCIPFGIGIKFLITREFTIGIEYGFRKTFTDYIDDVSGTYANRNLLEAEIGPESAYFSDPTGRKNANSQRGDPSDKDSYLFSLITVRYSIPYSHRFMGRAKF
ncbi:MAG: hypothetical protein KKD31_10320 [Bacteroidetes bacterium]|nr:hypothetical protein [Bacteroidota bacterium]